MLISGVLDNIFIIFLFLTIETCTGLSYEKIKQRVLYLQVLDYDRFSRNDPIGEIYLPLHNVNLGEELLHELPLEVCKGSVRMYFIKRYLFYFDRFENFLFWMKQK